jgi:hypothetical protein
MNARQRVCFFGMWCDLAKSWGLHESWGVRANPRPLIASVIMAVCPLTGGCPRDDVRSTTPDVGTPQTCGELQRMAGEVLTATIASTDQCTTKEDCGNLLRVSFSCLDCLHITGGERLQSAIAAQSPSIERMCEQFKTAGCVLIPSGCPPFVADPALECVRGRCVLPSEAPPTSCHWPASLDPTDAGAGRCRAKRHRLSCSGGDAGVFEECISDRADQCEDSGIVPGVTFTCRDQCQAGEYGVVCGGIGPNAPPSDPPAASCRSGAPTPAGVAFYCCPCDP